MDPNFHASLARDDEPTPREAAHQIARDLGPVFPCGPDKRPLTTHGFKDASRDPAQIDRWWAQHPNAMVGMPTGEPSGIWAVDVDVADGKQGLQTLGERGWKLDEIGKTAITRTATGGYHILYKYSPDTLVRNSAGKIGPDIDVRGEGGYLIMRGSRLADGRRYTWENPPGLFPVVDAPPDVLAAALGACGLVPKPFNEIPKDRAGDGSTAYGLRALRDECSRLAAAVPGTRNDTLNRAAFRMAQLIAIKQLTDAAARQGLLGAALACGLAAEDDKTAVLKTIESGLSAGLQKPRPASGAVPANDNAAGLLPTTEDGLARVLADRNADFVRHDHHAAAWFRYDGGIWRKDETGQVVYACRELCREASAAAPVGAQKVLGKMATVTGIERAARSDPRLAVTAEYWDTDHYLAGAAGCAIDLHTGQLMAPDPDHRLTNAFAVAPADTADCPRWHLFLSETFGGDVELIRFVQQFLGYSLTGDVSEHALLYGIGGGGNGKSVLVNVVSWIMGDYAITIPMETLAASQFDRHPTELAMLKGARFVTASETEAGRAWAEARIKALTGGDRIRARFMRQDFFEFDPTFKLFAVGNHQPRITTADEALRRRINIVPFNNKPAKPDPDLERQLRLEGPGILRWMIDGGLDWQANGLVRPPVVTQATAAYFDDQDLFQQWLGDECDAEPDNTHKRETATKLYGSWRDYTARAGEQPGHQNAFGERLKRSGFRSERNKNGRFWSGIQLRLPAKSSSAGGDDDFG